MKARIIKKNYYAPKLSVGDIIEIIPGMETDAESIWNAPAGKLALCRKKDGTCCYASMLDMEIVEYDTVDWSSFRREAAKDFVCALLQDGPRNEETYQVRQGGREDPLLTRSLCSAIR